MCSSAKFANLVLLISVFHCLSAQHVQFFDMGFDNPLSTIWTDRQAGYFDNNIVNNRIACSIGNGAERDGVCINSASCRFQGGIPFGRRNCGLWSTCCVFEKTSNQTSDSRVSYFVSPKSARERQQPQQMFLNLMQDVCQVRVDIINMILAPPTVVQTGTDPNFRYSANCIDDNLIIEPAYADNYLPDICGKNQNQHFYIHLDDNSNYPKGIRFSVSLNKDLTSEASWDIKLTQLRCPQYAVKHSPLIRDYRNRITNDFPLLAPRGCLQYFTERQGSFHNFGYISDTDTTLTTGQSYAICFKRYSGTCGLSLIATYMNLPALCAQEHIYFPEDPVDGTHMHCENDSPPLPAEVAISTPGPYYIRFYSLKDHTRPLTINRGFRYTYTLTANCPRL